MAGREVKVAILGDASSLKRAMADADAAAKRTQSSLKKTADTFDKAGNQLMATGGIMLAALSGMAKAADTAERTNLKLSNSIQNSSKMVASDKKAFDDLAVSMRGTTVVSAGTTKSAEALLIQFGLTKDQVLQLTPLVADLSRKMGIDMDQAAKMVAKSVGGNATALKKAGIAVDGVLFKTDAYLGTMDALRNSVGGFAEQEGKTFSGQLQIMKNELSAVSVGIGSGVLDMFKKLVGPVKAVSDAFASLPKPVQSAVGSIGAVAAGATILIGGMAKVSAAVMRAGESLGFLSDKGAQLTKIDYSGKWETSTNKATKSMVTLNSVVGAGAVLAAGAAAAWAIWAQRQSDLRAQGERVSKMLDDQIAKGAMTFAKLDKGIAAAADTYKYFKKEAGDVSWYEVWNLDVKPAFDGLADSAANMEMKMTLLRGVAEGLSSSLGISSDKALKMAQSNMANGRAMDDTTALIAEESDELKKSQKAWDDALKAAKGYFDFFRGQVDTLGSARQANREFVKTLQDNGMALDMNTDKGWANVQSLEASVTKWEEWGIAQIQAGAPIDETTSKVNSQIASLRNQYGQMGGNQAQFDFWVASLGATPKDVATAFSTPGLAEANAAVRELLGNLSALGQGEQIARQMAAYFNGIGATGIANQYTRVADLASRTGAMMTAAMPGRAVGGGVTAGGSYLVGERGPELLQMGNRSGQIVPAAQTAEALGGGGDLRVVVEIDKRAVAEAIYPEFRRREVSRL